jgi:hypothetical protein
MSIFVIFISSVFEISIVLLNLDFSIVNKHSFSPTNVNVPLNSESITLKTFETIKFASRFFFYLNNITYNIFKRNFTFKFRINYF